MQLASKCCQRTARKRDAETVNPLLKTSSSCIYLSLFAFISKKVKNNDLAKSSLIYIRAGGAPVWCNGRAPDSAGDLTCELCGSPLWLVAQLDSPVVAGAHRVLHVFVCNKRACSLKQGIVIYKLLILFQYSFSHSPLIGLALYSDADGEPASPRCCFRKDPSTCSHFLK